MVHRPSDSRLLTGLLSNEKEYHKQLLSLVDNYSQHSLTAFAAYASASPAPVARAVIAVAGSFAGADDALRRYAVSVEAWQAELRALKELEEEVGNVIRDREIFVTRLIKLSKNQKPTRDAFIGTLGSSVGDASQISLSSFTSATASSSKLGVAQAELQACEAHLAAKERELDDRRVSAVRRGLEARCKAMVECGWNWGEMGREGLRALEGIENAAVNGIDVSPHKPLPDPDRPTGSDLSSIGPSQSASQIHLPISPFSVPTDQPTPTPRVVSPAPVLPRSSSPLPMPPASSFTLQIPPAHAISELALPSTLDGPIDEEPEDLEQGSSEEDSRPVEVVENARFASAGTGANVGRRLSLRPPRSRDVSGSNTSSGTGTGTGSFSQVSSTTLAPPRRSVSLSVSERERKSSGGFFSSIAGLFRGGGSIGSGHSGGPDKWKTRTETNLRAVRRDEDTSSEDEAHNESPTRRFFSRRTSHEIPRPSPPTAQKLRKRIVQAEEMDQGWISDGAAVRGQGARKGSARKRSALPGTPSRPSHLSASTSVHSRSSSVAPVGLSAASTPGSLTPTRAKPNPKPKTDLRVEALSRSSVDISRQSSLRSTGSTPHTPRRLNYTEERAPGLPSSPATPGSGVGRKASLSHGKSASVTYPSAPLHADAGRAGSSQLSLMTIVEGVTKDNRNAWERASAGLPPAPAGSTSQAGGLLSVRAPPPVTKYNLRGEGGQGIAFESVRAPGSVFATPSRPAFASSAPQRPSSLPPPPRVPMPATPGSPPKVPLRSALRNHSPAPAPAPAPPPKPIVIPSAPPRVIIESDTTLAQTQIPNGRNHHEDDGDGSDSGSIQSFRTVRESLGEERTPTPPPATIPAVSSSPLVVPGQIDSDVSASSNSATGTGAGAGTRRRKSVRVSLQPTFSPSPPALDEDEDEIWKRSGRPEPLGGGPGSTNVHYDSDDHDHDHDKRIGRWKNGASARDRERDFWVDSSDEDEEYSKARRLLTRASKKRL